MSYLRLVHPEIDHKKAIANHAWFENLLDDLETRTLPEETVQWINEKINLINSFDGPVRGYLKTEAKAKTAIIERLKKEHKLVPRNYYRSTWTAIGMMAYGVPLGLLYSNAIGNQGMLGIGLPIGMVIGMAIGSGMDKKAAREGRQLSVEHG
jgi:hypothetical protein